MDGAYTWRQAKRFKVRGYKEGCVKVKMWAERTEKEW